MCLLSFSAASEQDHDDERGDPLDESGSHLWQEPAERSLSPLSRLLASEELHALLAHEGKYRKAIEQAEHVFIALDGTSGVRVRGGAKAVASAVRGIQDLFRSGCLAGDSSQSRRSSL